jgi:PilZ domain-containing protein
MFLWKPQLFLKPRRLGKPGFLIGIQRVPAVKKREVRKSIQQAGWVTLQGGFAARQCLVHDMSSTGAKITVSDDASALAGRVRLAFSRDAATGRPCEVVWQRGRSFGVKFVR